LQRAERGISTRTRRENKKREGMRGEERRKKRKRIGKGEVRGKEEKRMEGRGCAGRQVLGVQ
jgi:hypothetical protein